MSNLAARHPQTAELSAAEIQLIQALRTGASDYEKWERAVQALLSEDEADVVISMRREQQGESVPWSKLRAELVAGD